MSYILKEFIHFLTLSLETLESNIFKYHKKKLMSTKTISYILFFVYQNLKIHKIFIEELNPNYSSFLHLRNLFLILRFLIPWDTSSRNLKYLLIIIISSSVTILSIPYLLKRKYFYFMLLSIFVAYFY